MIPSLKSEINKDFKLKQKISSHKKLQKESEESQTIWQEIRMQKLKGPLIVQTDQ